MLVIEGMTSSAELGQHWDLKQSCLYGKASPPGGAGSQQKGKLGKRKSWVGRESRRCKGCLSANCLRICLVDNKGRGGKLTPFLNIQYGILRYRAAQLQSGQGLTNADGLFSQILNRYHFSFWLVTTIISCQENMEKCCFESIQSDFCFFSFPNSWVRHSTGKTVIYRPVVCLGCPLATPGHAHSPSRVCTAAPRAGKGPWCKASGNWDAAFGSNEGLLCDSVVPSMFVECSWVGN